MRRLNKTRLYISLGLGIPLLIVGLLSDFIDLHMIYEERVVETTIGMRIETDKGVTILVDTNIAGMLSVTYIEPDESSHTELIDNVIDGAKDNDTVLRFIDKKLSISNDEIVVVEYYDNI